MPFVNVKITKTGVTKEQKRAIVEGITETLVRVLNKRPDQTHIVIDEVELENWGVSSKLVADKDK
jgi:4-oxalocrotonate tautomerase